MYTQTQSEQTDIYWLTIPCFPKTKLVTTEIVAFLVVFTFVVSICSQYRPAITILNHVMFLNVSAIWRVWVIAPPLHAMDLLWEKFQWILPLYMKPISFQSKASVVCSVTAAIFIDFCLKKLNVFSQHIGQKTNEYLNSAEQIPRNWNVDQLSVLITSWDII